MNRQYMRTLKFSSNKTLTMTDMRSLLEWLDHIGLRDDQEISIRADDTQHEGYYFYATVEIDDTPKEADPA